MTRAFDPLFLAVQQALAGRYSLLAELGRGGMGVVYLGHEVRLDRPVAIKVLPPEHDVPARRERFLREARAAAQLSHPNIVPIHAVDEAGEFVFYAMAYVEGASLRALVEERGPLSAAETAGLMRDIARALGYAHARGIVHRDIKPDNILIERATGRPLVADFGIALVATATPTGLGLAIGTPEFMSPEQASGERVDARSDLYCLGAVGYYALTGRPPFTGEGAAEVMARHINEPPPRLARAVPGAAARLSRIIERCLAKDPTARYESGEVLAEALDDAHRRPRTLPAPLERWVRSVNTVPFRHVFILPPVLLGMTWGLDAWIDQLVCGGGGLWLGDACANPPGENLRWLLVAYVLPFVVYGGHRLLQVRRALREGFQLADLRSALVAEARAMSEPEATSTDRRARVKESFTGAAVATITLSVTMTCWDSSTVLGNLLLPAWLVTAGAVCAPTFFRPAGQSAAATDLRVRARLWLGRFGAAAMWLAGLWLKPHTTATGAATHRPTELALGSAVAALYEALPRDVRQQLQELPATVQLLETQAGRLRGRMLELEEMRGQAETGSGKARRMLEDHHRQLAAELAGRRTVAEQQLAAVVAALETLRINLIRLRAGTINTASITADIEAAQRVSADIDQLIEARQEVGELLRPGVTPS